MKKEVICLDVERNKFNVSINKLAFRPSVYGIIIEKGRILLSKQWDGYDFPGGGIEVGETVREALKREVKEETGLNIKIGKIVACENSFFKLPFVENKFVHSILIYYLCEKTGGKLTTKNFDADEKKYADMPEWIKLKDIKKIKFCTSVDSIRIIKDAVKL